MKAISPGAIQDAAQGARLLGNGRYAVFVNAAGAGFSWFDGHLLSKWDGDPLVDRDGFFLWIRDSENDQVYRTGVQSEREGGASWESGCCEIRRQSDGFESKLEILVSPADPFELRRLTIRNTGDRARTFVITSQIEIALSDPAAFAAHPSFSKLFIETEAQAEGRVLLARRRARGRGERHPWMVHAVDGTGAVEWETDRAHWHRRGDFENVPHAIRSPAPLSGTVGNVLDPMFALRRTVVVKPDAEETVTFLLGAAPDPETALELASVLERPNDLERAIDSAKDRTTPAVEEKGISSEEAEELQDRIGAIFFGGQDAQDEKASRLVAVLGGPDLLMLAPSPPAPSKLSDGATRADAAAAIFPPASSPALPARRSGKVEHLLFFNGHGGFARSGKEYIVRIPHRATGGLSLPPRPWINVFANEHFGCLLSETGAGMTWSQNSREYRLTPWANDPLCDPHSEAIYLRDEETREFWSPLPGPAPGVGDYEARHGFGKSVFLHDGSDFDEHTEVFVARNDSVKITTIRIRNRGDRVHTLSLFAYSHLVLGTDARAAIPSISSEAGPYEGTLFAKTARGGDIAGRVAFAGFAAQARVRAVSVSGDRESFLGRRGTLARPRALAESDALDGIVGDGLDPCFAQQIVFDLGPGEEARVSFLLGDAASAAESAALLARYSDPRTIDAERDAAHSAWHERLSAIEVETPSPALDLLLNGWLMHQVLACRMWGRSALYQSGGAYGFRDQLQDASALMLVHPQMTRAQILLHAAHQFPEGDVLHWWHPPRSRGIRTRFADDLLWLPYLTAEYVRATGDQAVLDEHAPFVAAPLLDQDEDERYLLPTDSGERASVFEHCVRAIERALPRKGAHSLPLFGCGDWNDGMNRVGRAGRGESVWMGFFLATVLELFAPLSEARGDVQRAQRYRAERAALQAALNDAGWDGEWYRRGYYDGGEPLGSASSDECRIDALAQAWAVLSKTASADRARQAMGSVEHHLLSERDGLIRLLTPAFRDTPLDPGYI
ncbi:MAG TPA: glycosyl transferase, partial [bacterium]|nr:glycosyl transferase [bacterium]